MNLRYLLILYLFSSLLACSTPAPQLDEMSDSCSNASQAQQIGCQQQRYKVIDARLNQIYKRLRQQLTPSQASDLRQAQRTWLPYRDLHCEHVLAQQQAHLQPRLKPVCLANMTQERVTALQNYQNANRSLINLDYTQVDKRLNQIYRQQMRNITRPQQQSLRQAQRVWLAFRDAECTAQQSIGVAQNICLAQLTQKRNEKLQQPLLMQTDVVTVELNEKSLFGNWQRLKYEGDLRLSFGVRNGVHYYASQLEQLPYEAGQWQLKQAYLSITDSRGRLLYAYLVLGLNDGVLSLQQADGRVVQYRKLDN